MVYNADGQEYQLPTAVLRNGGFSSKLKFSFQIKFCGRQTVLYSEIPHYAKP